MERLACRIKTHDSTESRLYSIVQATRFSFRANAVERLSSSPFLLTGRITNLLRLAVRVLSSSSLCKAYRSEIQEDAESKIRSYIHVNRLPLRKNPTSYSLSESSCIFCFSRACSGFPADMATQAGRMELSPVENHSKLVHVC